jgi:hypothetical protein
MPPAGGTTRGPVWDPGVAMGGPGAPGRVPGRAMPSVSGCAAPGAQPPPADASGRPRGAAPGPRARDKPGGDGASAAGAPPMGHAPGRLGRWAASSIHRSVPTQVQGVVAMCEDFCAGRVQAYVVTETSAMMHPLGDCPRINVYSLWSAREGDGPCERRTLPAASGSIAARHGQGT